MSVCSWPCIKSIAYGARFGGEVAVPHAWQLLHGILGTLKLDAVLLVQAELKQRALCTRADGTKINGISKHRISVIDRAIVCVLGIRERATLHEVTSNIGVGTRLMA